MKLALALSALFLSSYTFASASLIVDCSDVSSSVRTFVDGGSAIFCENATTGAQASEQLNKKLSCLAQTFKITDLDTKVTASGTSGDNFYVCAAVTRLKNE